MSNLVAILAENGFEPIESDLPGGWSTDGEVTVCVHTEMIEYDRFVHEAAVYDAPGDDVGPDTDRIAVERHRSTHVAIKNALTEAEVLD